MIYTVFDLLKQARENYPDKKGIIQLPGKEISYLEVYESVLKFSAYLKAIGIKKGDRIGIYLPNCIEHIIAIFAAAKIGAVFVSININSVEMQIEHILNNCGIKLLILDASDYNKVSRGVRSTDLKHFITTGDICQGADSFEEILNSYASDNEICTAIDQDLASIIYTSGSTGKAKGIMITHSNLVMGAKIVSDYLKITKEERILSVLPFNFDYGLNQLLSSFLNSSTIVMKWPFTFFEIPSIIENYSITGLAGIPTIWVQLMQNRYIEKFNYRSLRYVTNSGGKIPDKYVDKMQSIFKDTEIFLMYGLTEGFRCTYLHPSEIYSKKSSIGKAIPNTEVFVVNENNELCKPFEHGELVYRGPNTALGYWGDEEATRKVFRPNPFSPPQLLNSERVVYSGDIVYSDEEGYLYFVGRKGGMIKSKGFRISPTEIEEVLYKHPSIFECAVVGVKDSEIEEKIVACVKIKEGHTFDEKDIRSFCAGKLPVYMMPQEFVVREEMPKTSTGKIDRVSLLAAL
ncbi:hypothetical protein A7W90_12935 [Clostridium sp. Bc-iso-3]|nr:hypothetical protein A7W90_12935 [Clostridium sp. Bc-iso-3]